MQKSNTSEISLEIEWIPGDCQLCGEHFSQEELILIPEAERRIRKLIMKEISVEEASKDFPEKPLYLCPKCYKKWIAEQNKEN